jgi:hypothetical protein
VPHTSGLGKWGWEFRKTPSLSKMLDEIKQNGNWNIESKGYELTASLNSLVHGKPDSAFWGMVVMENGNLGNAPSKMINSPRLCDELCADIVPWLVVVVSMICAYFPEIEA